MSEGEGTLRYVRNQRGGKSGLDGCYEACCYSGACRVRESMKEEIR